MFDGLLDLFLPPTCVACAAVLPAKGFFCDACEPLVLETPPVHCRRCAEGGEFERGLCPRCTHSPPPFDLAFAPFEHEGAVATAIHRFKYDGKAELAKPLGQLMVATSKAFASSLGDVTVCPMPVHDERYRERGFDQAMLLAVEVAKGLGFRLGDCLTRVKATVRQVGLSEIERERNVREAFSVHGEVKGKSLLLINDVLTTGATAREAAAVLKAQRAAQVFVLTLARARRESLHASRYSRERTR